MTAQQTFKPGYEAFQLSAYGNVTPEPATLSEEEIWQAGLIELERMDMYLQANPELEFENYK